MFSCAWILMATGALFAQPKETEPRRESSGFAFELIGEMFESCSRVSTMTCEVQKKERFDGKYIEARSLIKMSTSPYAVYLKQMDGNNGVELLYRESANSGKVLVNPNGFPWINLSLDPNGSLIRNNQHHMISDIGFSKFNRVLAHLLKKYEHVGDELTQYQGEETINGRPCHVVEIINHHYDLIEYTPGAGETTTSISEKLKISEYRIVELNSSVSGYGAVSAGTKLKIPNDYAPRIKLFIDQERYIPMRFEVYDEEGQLFEAYQYDRVELNTQFEEKELTAEYPEYGF